MRKTIPLLLLMFSVCLPQMFLLGQDSSNATTDTMPVKVGRDSIRSRTIQLPFYTVPTNLTAASADAVYSRDLVKNPVRNVLNALTGRLAGVVTNQGSGQPLSDDVSFQVHGRSPLVMIDGVARTLTTLDLEEIESITVVKDAIGVAMLGVRGANDAVLITTKKGTPSRQSISFTAQNAWQQPLGLTRPLDAYNYALLRNEAVNNELSVNPSNIQLKSLQFPDVALQAYQNGTDPYTYPNVNWQDVILRKNSKFDRYSLGISGGNNTSRYYVALEHLKQEGLFNESDINPYSTNNGFKSYIARTNIDINITPKLTAGIALLGRIINSTEPGGARDASNNPLGTGSIYSALNSTPNNAYPIYNRDSSFAGTGNFQNNLLAQTISSGYLQQYRRDILTDFNLRRTLDEITPGLWVKAKLSYSSNLTENTNRSRPVITYQQNATGAGYTQYGVKADQVNTTTIGSQGRADYFELQLGYQHTFGQHGIDAIVMQNRDNMVSGLELPYTISGTSARVSYNFNQRYILEGVITRNGSNRYAGGDTRYGYFPAIGVAWNIAGEGFMSSFTKLNSLKLYASYGKMGADNPGYFSYIQRYPNGAQAFFGTAATGNTTIMQGPLANPNITWEKVNKFNLGIRGDLLQNRLGFSVEYYNNKFSDLLIQRGRNTTLLGSAYPNENIGQNRYSGVDFQLSWQSNSRSDFNYYVSANATIQQSEVLFADEPNYLDPYTFRTGNVVGRPYGYVADGLFQTAAEVAASPTVTGYKAQPGDIRFKDLNSDGVIDVRDIAAIGTDKPLTAFGINLGFSFKSFDVSALVQGVVNRNIFLSGNGYYEFQNSGLGQAYEQHLDRWTPTNTDATYPRLSIGNNPNNHAFSSFWVRNGNYIRLKNAEIGYTVAAGILKKVRVASVRIFANGLNLLTAASIKNQDPEVYSGSYPLQRLYNFGINIKF